MGVAWRGDQDKPQFGTLNGPGVEDVVSNDGFRQEVQLEPALMESPRTTPNEGTSLPASLFDYGHDPTSSLDQSSDSHSPEEEVSKVSEPLPLPWAVTYAPYTSQGACKKPSQMEHDIRRIASKGFSSIRLHSPDCSILYFIGPIVKKYHMSLILGVYVAVPQEDVPEDHPAHTNEQAKQQAQAQIQDIITWAQGDYSQVEMVVVGDEAIFNGFISSEDLAMIITSAREQLTEAGYDGPVTTTEPVMTLVENAGELCPVLDVLAANIQPYFSDHVSPYDAGQFLRDELIMLSYVCSSDRELLRTFSMESGWPKAGVRNGKAIAGVDEQWVAMRSILEQGEDVVSRTVLGSWEDEAWREEGEWGVERSWGVQGAFESV